MLKEDGQADVYKRQAYGNTGKIAQAIAQGIKEALPDANCAVYDVNDHDMGCLLYTSWMRCPARSWALGMSAIPQPAIVRF